MTEVSTVTARRPPLLLRDARKGCSSDSCRVVAALKDIDEEEAEEEADAVDVVVPSHDSKNDCPSSVDAKDSSHSHMSTESGELVCAKPNAKAEGAEDSSVRKGASSKPVLRNAKSMSRRSIAHEKGAPYTIVDDDDDDDDDDSG